MVGADRRRCLRSTRFRRVVPRRRHSQCGTACKHPGANNTKTYHFTFCFSTNTALVGGVVNLESMTIIGGGSGGGEPENNVVVPTTVSVTPGTPTCIFVDAAGFDDSQNGLARLFFSYTTVEDPTLIEDTVETAFLSIPPCNTGADDRENPDLPHTPQGSGNANAHQLRHLTVLDVVND